MKLLKVSTLGLLLGGLCLLDVCADEVSSQGSSWSMKIEQHGDEDPNFESEAIQYKDGQVVDKKHAKGIIDQYGNFVPAPAVPETTESNTTASARVFVPKDSDLDEFEPENDGRAHSLCPIKPERKCPSMKFKKRHCLRGFGRPPVFSENFEEKDQDSASYLSGLRKIIARELRKLLEEDELMLPNEKEDRFDDSQIEKRKKMPYRSRGWKRPHSRHEMILRRPSAYSNHSNFGFKERSQSKETEDEARFSSQDDDDFEFLHPSFRNW